MNEQYYHLDKDNKLIWNFRDIGHTMRRTSEGKGSQKRILILLLESGGMTQKELTERLGIQPGSVSEVLGKLEGAELIQRRPSHRDRRTTDICLTPKGEALAQEAYISRKKRHDQMFSVLTEQEKDTLIELLERLNGAWENSFADQDGV